MVLKAWRIPGEILVFSLYLNPSKAHLNISEGVWQPQNKEINLLARMELTQLLHLSFSKHHGRDFKSQMSLLYDCVNEKKKNYTYDV